MEYEYLLQVEGMRHKSCQQKIQQTLSRLPGVELVQVDWPGGRIGVAGGGLDVHEIVNSIEEMGYTAFEY